MNVKFKILGKALIGLCLLVMVLDGGKIFLLSRGMDYSARPFERIRDNAALKILFLGDSTAVGIGSATPQTSIAGWFSRDFPEASIENIGQTGLRLAGLRKKLDLIQRNDYDIIILQIGANDIMRLTSLTNIHRDLRFILEFVRKKTKQVVILHSGDIGTAPMFIWPVSWILSKRSYAVRRIYQKAVQDTGALYVDLIDLSTDRVFTNDQSKYYASDRLHLSGDGYRVWYEAIRTCFKPP